MFQNSDLRFEELAAQAGFDPMEEARTAGSYATAALHDRMVFVSGQVPRLGQSMAIVGRIGGNLSQSEGYWAAQICAFRALAILRTAAGGSLDNVEAILRVCVYVQCDRDFDDISGVANGASDLFTRVLAQTPRHARTSLGVDRLPKNAPVELDLIALLK